MADIIPLAAYSHFVAAFYIPIPHHHLISAATFATACGTDRLYGYLARYLKQTSQFGAFLDPVADKMVVVVALLLLVGEPYFSYLTLPAIVIVVREIFISSLREWMAEIKLRHMVAVSRLGKTKTFLQMIAIILLLLYSPTEGWQWFRILGTFMLYVAAAVTLWTLLVYLRIAWPELYATRRQ